MSNFVFFSEVVATDGSGKGSNANGSLKSVVRCFINRYVAGKEVMCRKARSKPMFFTVVLAMVGMVFCMQKAEAQVPFAKHFWLNPRSVNYTLSDPTSNNEWMLAAAMQEENATTKNTIAVFRLGIVTTPWPGNEYGILDNRVIGRGTGTQFNKDVDFEVHCIVQSVFPTDNYIICGSMRENADAPQNGMVVILDAGLNVMDIREYDSVETFYSVYAENNYYYVCGKTHTQQGIVLRDNVATISMGTNSYVTTIPWTYHKIKVRPSHSSTGIPAGIFSVSGSSADEDGNQEMGYTVFNILNGNFAPSSSCKFPPMGHSIESKVVLSNYPHTQDLGLILSVSDKHTIYTYLIDSYWQTHPLIPPPVNATFRIPCPNGDFILEDMDCSPEKLAWVGNSPQQRAHYVSLTSPMPFPPSFPPTPVRFIEFENIPQKNTYHSLHKVHFYGGAQNPGGDDLFHTGGYYYNGSDKTTFVVTPEHAISYTPEFECIREIESEAFNWEIPVVSALPITTGCYYPEARDWLIAKYQFCISDECEIISCKPQIIFGPTNKIKSNE